MPLDRWVAIDFETATREATSACALGVAIIEGDAVVDTASWLIRPPFNEYEFRNTMVHGLSAEDTELAPEFDEVWWEIRQVLEGARLLAHHAAFDIRVLRALLDSREIPAPAYEYACTVAMARAVMPELPNHKLNTVCEACGIELVHHEAQSDARACARVALQCAAVAGVRSVGEAVSSLGVVLRTV